MNNNFNVQMNREVNAVSVTCKEFANDNDIDYRRLSGIIANDETIKSTFCRNRVLYFRLEDITDWFNKNKHRFLVEPKNVKVVNGEFFCLRGPHYVPVAYKGKSGNYCTTCEAKAAENKRKSNASGFEGRGKVPEHVTAFVNRRNNLAFNRELAAIDDINGWMEL